MKSILIRKILLKWSIAMAGIILATILQSVLWPWIGPSRFILYYPGIILISFLGGWAAGVAGTVMGVFVAEYFFFPPLFTLGINSPADLPALSIFVFSGLTISYLNDYVYRHRAEKERVKLSGQLERERVKLAAILEQAAESVFVLDEKGAIEFANKEAQKVFGYTSDEFLGRDLHELTHHHRPDGSEYLRRDCPMALAYSQGHVMRTYEEVLIRKDGAFIPISYSHAPLLLQGERVGSILLATDISERRKMDRELRAALEKAEEAVRMRDEFISIASHELKTPLTSLKLQNQLRRRALNKQGMEYFTRERLEQLLPADEVQLDRLVRLVDDMLDVSRMNAGRMSIEKSRQDLCEIAREVVGRLCGDRMEEGLSIALDLAPKAIGNWDRTRIEQIIGNLLSNAIKYGNHTPIRVSVRAENGMAELRVRDEGRGISAGDQQRVFERFERAVKPGTVGGMGLGLYIVRQLVNLHDGEIEVESELGKGATFTVRLPLLAEEVA